MEIEEQEQQEIIIPAAITVANPDAISEKEPQGTTKSQAHPSVQDEIPIMRDENPPKLAEDKYAETETIETVPETSPKIIEEEPAVAAPVDLDPVIITPIPTEVESEQTERITDLNPDRVVFVKPTEAEHISSSQEKIPLPKISPDLPRDAKSLDTPPRETDKNVTVVYVDPTPLKISPIPLEIGYELAAEGYEIETDSYLSTPDTLNTSPRLVRGNTTEEKAQAQQEPENQSIHTVSGENPSEETRINSIKRVVKDIVDMQVSIDNQDTVGEDERIIALKDNEGRIILGIQNTQAEDEDDEEKSELQEPKPITTIAQLGEVFEHIDRLILNIQLDKEFSMESNLEDEEQGVSEIVIVVSDEMLEFIERIRNDAYFPLEEQTEEDEGVIARKTFIFSTNGENKKQLIIDDMQLLQIRQYLIGLDLNFDQNTQAEDDKEMGGLPELNPITTITKLGETLNYINKLTLNALLNKELNKENDLEEEEQVAPEIVLVVSDEILEFIEVIREDFYSSSEQQTEDEGIIEGQAVTFTIQGENQRKLTVDARQLSQIGQLLTALDLIIDEGTQDGAGSALPEQDKFGEEIESFIQEIEWQEKEETPELTMFVSEDLMTFIDNGKKIIEEIEQISYANTPGRNKGEKETKKETKMGQYVTIFSADREVTIDLVTLKKLVRLLKKKRRIDIVNSSKESAQAPEEIKGNIKLFHNGNNLPIWFMSQIMIFLLALAKNQRSPHDLTSHKFYLHPIFHA